MKINLLKIATALCALCCTVYSAAGELQGTVYDDQGKPLRNAIVAATSIKSEFDVNGQTIRHITRTDDQGHYILSDLHDGVYNATATHSYLGAAFLKNLSVPESGVLNGQIFHLNSSTTTITGNLRVKQGEPPKDIVMQAVMLEGDNEYVFYGDIQDLHFRLNLLPGKYFIGAKGIGWSTMMRSFNFPGVNTQPDWILYPENGIEPGIATEILAMKARDQDIRNRLIQAGGKDVLLLDEMEKIDTKNQERLKEITRDKGWPGIELVGNKAASAAWIMFQHASPEFLKLALPQMMAAAEKGELSWSFVALSIDRDLMYDGKKQLYGSQFQSNANGAMEMYPVEDEDHLDERRMKMGLGSIAEYKKIMLQAYTPKSSEK